MFKKILVLCRRFVDGQIEMEPLEHTAMEEELNKPEYGTENYWMSKITLARTIQKAWGNITQPLI